MTLGLRDPTEAIRGVGPRIARHLADAGVHCVGDLLWHLPFRWEDRAHPRSIASLSEAGETVTILVRVDQLTQRRARSRRLRIVEATVSDESGSLPVVWFNQPYLTRALGAGCRTWLHGVVRAHPTGWGLQLVSPEWEPSDEEGETIHHGRIVPIYRRLGPLAGRRLRSLVRCALDELAAGPDLLLPSFPGLKEVPALAQALQESHFPPAPSSQEETQELITALAERTAPAPRRLALEELTGLAVALERERQRRHALAAPRCRIDARLRDHARAILPFRLTGAQRRVLAEIVADLRRPYPMARLLQGDVGSGKTVVATLAGLVAAESGLQVALLAPTELLAQQHHATLTRLLAPTTYRPALLIGSLSAEARGRVHAGLAAGEEAVVVGTHALLQERVDFARLGLAIIDEQHRFGVAERERLVAKGVPPHVLVMTATPIPRSLALSLYGDLDVSVLDERPPGRREVRTVLRDEGARPRLAEFLRREVASGGQAYWVVPLIEESEVISVRALTTHVREVRTLLPDVRVGIVHGRLAAADREAVMAAFGAGEISVLCATTVVEVGVDVPNATVMVIENAERFGLAQLHQLRGRVGRGPRRSYCVALAGRECSPESLRRLEVFVSTSDGFRIAEEDFRLRGPGEITGLRQWGRAGMRIASLWRHRDLLEEARDVAGRAAAAGALDGLERAVTWPGTGGRVGVG
jgi:ATP-dependent DNA helicase RecG